MSKKNERRQERLRAESEHERQVAVTTPRHIHDDDWGYPGIGHVLLKVVRRPTFEHTVCYELRGTEGSLRLFRSLSTAPGALFVIGYNLVAADPTALGRIVRSISALSIPVRARLDSRGVLDGETYELTSFGGTQAVSRFSWRGGYAPEGWAALENLVQSAFKEFELLAAAPKLETLGASAAQQGNEG